MNPASKASPAPVVSAATIGRVATSNRIATPAERAAARSSGPGSSRTRTVTPGGAALDRRRSAPGRRPARPSGRRRRAARGARRPSRTGGPGATSRTSASAAPRPSARSGPIEARSRLTQCPGGSRQAHGRAAGRPERLAEQRVRRQVEQVGALEPGAPQVRRRERVGRASVGDERALAVRTRRAPRSGRSGRRRPGGRGRDADRPAAPRRAPGPAASRPTERDERRSGRRAAPASGRCSPPSRPGGARPGPGRRSPVASGRPGASDDVEHEVAEDDDPRPAPADDPAVRRAGGPAGPVGPDGGDPARSVGDRTRIADRATMTVPERARRWKERESTDDDRHRPARPPRDRHDPDALHRRGPEGELRAIRGRRWAWRPMAYVLWTRYLRHAPTRPDWPDRDRFVLSRRARLDAALLAPLPDRLRPVPGRPRAVPPVGLADARPSRVRADPGRRGDDRTARPGRRERRRDGHRRAPAGGRVQPPRPHRSSTIGRS